MVCNRQMDRHMNRRADRQTDGKKSDIEVGAPPKSSMKNEIVENFFCGKYFAVFKKL